MAARAGIISLSPDLDLEEAKKRIRAEQSSQLQGAQNFGSSMDQRLQGIYGQLIGAQQQGAQTTQGIYNNAAQGVQQAYQSGGAVANAGAQQVQESLANMARQIGLDPAALKEVSGRLGEQAMKFGMSQQQGMTSRVGNIQQLGAGMSGIMQMGVQTAQQAMAQGRQDIARKVTTEVQRINTLAAQTQTGFTGIKADQMRKTLADTQKELMRAAAELEREQRASARSAGSLGGLSWLDKFMLTNEENDRRYMRGNPLDETIGMNQGLAARVAQYASPGTQAHFQAAAGTDNPMSYVQKLDAKTLRKEGVSKEKLIRWVGGLR